MPGSSTLRPRITVAIPFLDEARFLADAVGSVFAQTESSWELLLIDDGSTDGSSEIADDLARTCPDLVFVLRHPGRVNRGLAASRNLALDRARGEFLCFLDADDQWSPDKLSRQKEILAASPTVAMTCGPSRHQPAGSSEPGPVVPVLTDSPRLLRRGQFARMRMRGRLRTPPPSDVMYRTSALRRCGGVPEGPAVIEDQRTYVAVSLEGPVYVDDRVLTTYTVRNDSLYGSGREDSLLQVRNHREFERWVVAYCARSGLRGLTVIACLMERRLRRGVTRRLAERRR